MAIVDDVRDYCQATNDFGARVRAALRSVIPRDPSLNVLLTVRVLKGNIRVDIQSQSKDPDWKDSSQ